MATDINSEILTASEYTVKAAKKELGKTLDYSLESLKILEALIQRVRNHFIDLKKEQKLTEQIVQRASVSIGAYLGEVIRRHYGGNWIAKNAIMKVLVINGHEFSPIRYIFQCLTKDSDYSLERYLSDVKQKLQPPVEIENKPPVLETPKKTVDKSAKSTHLITNVIIGILVLCVLCIFGIVGLTIYSNTIRIPPTITPHPTATRIPTSRPRPTNTPRPVATRTPIPTTTTLLYKADASTYVLSESEIPDGFIILPGQTGFQTANTTSGFLSGYLATYKNGSSGILGTIQTSGYVFSVEIYVFTDNQNARQEFEYRTSLTKDTENVIVKSAGAKNIEGTDRAHLLLGVYDLDGLIANDATIIFQKENVVGVITSIGSAGAPSLGIEIDIDTATKYRINEANYYTGLVLRKIH
jgi:hypothetical protein